MEKIDISIVVPVYNEVESLPVLHQQLDVVLSALQRPYEIIFVDDGSADGSFGALETLAEADPCVRVVQFRCNFGKAAALTAGFRAARGDVVFTMDADLQDDPQEIPRFLEVLEGGNYDLVSGWKYPRLDPATKTVPSRLFNWTTSALSGVKLHDFNCGFKAYRREVIQEIVIYGELYRYIPVMAHWKGFRVTEMKVKHHPRRFGHSKYGMKRFLRGFFDLLTVLFLTRYIRRPLHLFGGIGLGSFSLGTLISIYLTILWFVGDRPIGDRPLLMLGVLLIIIGVQFFALGLVAELITRLLVLGGTDYSVRTTIR